jgi:phosphomannomutase
MRALRDITKANDIRGAVPADWGPREARAIGAALADFLQGEEHMAQAEAGNPQQCTGSLLVGRDMRVSGPEMAAALIAGVNERGMDVIDIGLCSTDTTYFASGSEDLPGAMITASHNPAEYSGMKVMVAGARPIGRDSGLGRIVDLATRYLESEIPVAQRPGQTQAKDVLPDYARFLRSLVDLSADRPLKVVVDAGNGMGGVLVEAVLGSAAGLPALPVEIIPLYFTPDGTFPNHEPNPLVPENLQDLQAAVIANQADLGFAFDGDADRCFVIDEQGKTVNPSVLASLVALDAIQSELAAGHEPTIIHNLITSRAYPEFAAAAGARTIRTPVGHAYIKRVMAQNNAVFGAEHSGHYYFRSFYFADTGILMAMHLLRELGRTGLTVSELAETYSPYCSSGEINTTVPDVEAALQRITAAYADDVASGAVSIDEMDGVTVSHWDAVPRWWFNVRPSNTEPLLRLNVEAADEDIMEKVRDGVRALITESE